MYKNYLVYTKNGNKVFSKEEIINNALEQEKKGIKPHYAFYDYKKHKHDKTSSNSKKYFNAIVKEKRKEFSP